MAKDKNREVGGGVKKISVKIHQIIFKQLLEVFFLFQKGKGAIYFYLCET